MDTDTSKSRRSLGKEDDHQPVKRRETGFLPDGTYVFHDELTLAGVLSVQVITAAAWLLEVFHVRAGAVALRCNSEHVRPRGKCFGVFYPRFSIAELRFEDARSRVLGFAGSSDWVAGFASVPTMFETDVVTLPATTSAAEILHAARNRVAVAFNSNASALSVRAKQHIDRSYLGVTSITAIARQLRVRPEHLSRQFKRDFRLSPRDYLHRLRIADAPLRLAQGEAIASVSYALGYPDLSRFYQQFRKRTQTSPGLCRALLTPPNEHQKTPRRTASRA